MNEIRILDIYSSFFGSEVIDYEKNETKPLIRKRTVLTKDFISRIRNYLNVDPIILPKNCRYYSTNNSGVRTLVIEEEPRIRSIRLDLSMLSSIERLKKTGKIELYGFNDFLDNNKSPYTFMLSMPYIIYIINIDIYNNISSFKIFFRVSPLNSLSDYLFKANLTNISKDDQMVCLGDGNVKRGNNLAESVESTISQFWDSPFNSDYSYNYEDYAEVPEVCDYLTWNYYTRIDPMFIFSVKWIPFKYNLGQTIKNYMDGNSEETNINLNFSRLYNIFDKTIVEDIKNDSSQYVIDDTDSILIGDECLSIGDSFTFTKDREVFVDSFIRRKDREEITHIKIEDNNSKLRILKLSDKLKKFIERNFKNKNEVNSVHLPNGKEIKKDDIIKLNQPYNNYQAIKDIRKARDGNIEVKLGSNYHLIENIDGDILDIDNISFGGFILNREDVFLMWRDKSNKILVNARKVKFKDIHIDGSNITLIFEEYHSHIDVKISLNKDSGYKIRKNEDFENLSEIFRYNFYLFDNNNSNIIKHKTENYLLNTSIDSNPLEVKTINKDILQKNCFSDNEIHIKGLDIDIDLKVGDKVIMTDWQNPAEMLKVKTISSFEYTDSEVYVEAINSEGIKAKVRYIGNNNTYIRFDIIRKVCDNWNDVLAGSKIRSKFSGISNFPKKDINSIIGFIYDTGEDDVLVLCSNCCTLWFSDLINNFEIIPKSSSKWEKLVCSPINISKIKVQDGDIVEVSNQYNNSSILYLLSSKSFSLNLYTSSIRDMCKYVDYYFSFKKNQANFNFIGILNPRFTQKQISCFDLKTGDINFLGSFTENKNSILGFRTMGRRLSDV